MPIHLSPHPPWEQRHERTLAIPPQSSHASLDGQTRDGDKTHRVLATGVACRNGGFLIWAETARGTITLPEEAVSYKDSAPKRSSDSRGREVVGCPKTTFSIADIGVRGGGGRGSSRRISDNRSRRGPGSRGRASAARNVRVHGHAPTTKIIIGDRVTGLGDRERGSHGSRGEGAVDFLLEFHADTLGEGVTLLFRRAGGGGGGFFEFGDKVLEGFVTWRARAREAMAVAGPR